MNRNLFIRLAFAAHRVADTLPDEEIRKEIKESSNEVLADLILFSEKGGLSREQKKALIPQLLRQIDILLVYFGRAKREEWARPENFLLLEDEYGKLKDLLKIFEDIEEEEVPVVQKQEKALKQEVRKEIVRKKEVKEKRKTEKSEITERQKRILDFLKAKNSAQVWELQKVLPQVTKRTLRRDLDGLLQLNLVERKGEWNSVVYELKERDLVG